MRVIIKPTSPRYDDWVEVFGTRPIEVELAGSRDTVKRLRVILDKLTPAQRQRCTRYISWTMHVPVDQAERISPTIAERDVEVVPKLFE